jgi:hypothetical protein
MSGQSLIPEDEPSSKALEEERSPNPVIKSSILETLALCIDVHVLGTSHRRAPKRWFNLVYLFGAFLISNKNYIYPPLCLNPRCFVESRLVSLHASFFFFVKILKIKK